MTMLTVFGQINIELMADQQETSDIRQYTPDNFTSTKHSTNNYNQNRANIIRVSLSKINHQTDETQSLIL